MTIGLQQNVAHGPCPRGLRSRHGRLRILAGCAALVFASLAGEGSADHVAGARELDADPASVAQYGCPADLCVGRDFALAAPSQAAAQAQEGDTVLIQEGTYNDCATWSVSVTIRGFNGRPRIGNEICGRKAVWVVRGDETEIENVELFGGSGPDRNGESIRQEGRRLVVRDSMIHSSRMGILTNHDGDMSLEIYHNEFHGMESSSGLAHHVYAGRIGRFVAEGNYLHDDSTGHRLKSVAAENRVRYNYVVTPRDARAALIDLWGCSDSEIVGNILVYGGDHGALQGISLTERKEGDEWLPCERRSDALIAYNTAVFTSADSRWSSFVRNHSGVSYDVVNNLVVNTRDVEFQGAETGVGKLRGNRHHETLTPELFVDPTSHDFRPGQPISGTVATGSVPEYAYSHPRQVRRRASADSPGAHEHASD